MTHEELLAEIDSRKLHPAQDITNHQTWEHKEKLYHALRAVVELHKPIKKENINLSREWLECSFCNDGCWGCEEWACSDCECNCHKNSTSYPCPTIQAIEKELL